MNARKGRALVAMGLGLVALLGLVGALAAERGEAPAAGEDDVLSAAPAVWYVDRSHDDGLVGWWTFDEGNTSDLADASLYGNHGTIDGTLAYTTGVPVDIQFADPQAATFSGDDWVTVADDSTLDLEQALTMAVWIKTSDPGTDQKIMGKVSEDSPGIFDGYLMGIINEHAYIEIWGTDGKQTVIGGTIQAGTWTHLAVTGEANGQMVTYVDGQAVDTRAITGTITTNDNPLRIGVAPWDTGAFRFEGDLDDARLCNRALAADEVAALAAGGDHDGAGWDDPFTTVQRALTDAQPGDEIWVARGVYTPTRRQNASEPRTATFTMVPTVTVYGGFDPGGGADTLEERDPAAYLTVLSGDLEGNDTTDGYGVVTTTENIEGSNSIHVVTGGGADETAVLDGFAITAGNADGTSCPGPGCGGGIFASGLGGVPANPTVRNITFSGNMAWMGGGMSCDNGASPTLDNVVFSGNSATSGGGMWIHGANSSLVNVVFSGNSANDSGGMYLSSNSSSLVNVTFSGNSAGWAGGIGVYGATASLANCILWGNTSHQIYNSPSSATTINFSLVQGGCPTGSTCVPPPLTDDPLFVDAAGSDLRLRPDSPAIDAGDNAAVPEGVTTDLAGWARVINGRVDMGAYETPLAVYLPLVLRAAP
jgi:hypothetical protein